jgi:diguanylate cyclase (GGDEF)-like protein
LISLAWHASAGATTESPSTQLAVVVGSERTEIQAQQLALLEDAEGRLSIEEVLNAWETGQFQQGPGLDTNRGTTDSVFWARFVLENPTSTHLRRVLTHDYAATDVVQIFLPGAAGELVQMHGGDSGIVSDGNRRIPGFAVELAPAAVIPVVMRVSTTSNLNFELSVWPPREFDRYERNISLAYGLLFGAILATVLYMAFAWFLARDPTALMLAAYLLSYAAYLSFLNGFPANWLLPAAAGAINSLHMASLGCLFGFGALFYRTYLDLKNSSPRADRVVTFLQWAGFSIILSPILPPPVLGIITLIVAGPGPLITTGLAFYMWAQRHDQAGVFAIGWTVAHVSSLLGTLRVVGVLPNYEIFIHLPAIGCALSFSFFGWAIAQRLSRDRGYAYEDLLTGLANRRRFEDQIGIEFTRACRYGRPLSLIMLDVDKFKSVNDSDGHSFGDRVLRDVAIRCQEQSRGTDLIARIGGEEFAIVLVETGIEEATAIAERLRATQAGTPTRHRTVTISLGVSEIRATDKSIGELLDRVDRALYKAKNTGRNKVESSATGEPGVNRATGTGPATTG